MTRTYTMTRRAEQQAGTRQRIVEAAVELHSTLGPAHTPLSAVAERAGVQRHTLYAHFPDERRLLLACSGLTEARDPLPDPEPWRALAEPRARLRGALPPLYDWYARNEALLACVLRDAEHHAPTRETVAVRFAPRFAAWREIMGAGLSAKQRALLPLALSFHTWRTLARDGGLSPKNAATTMAGVVLGAR